MLKNKRFFRFLFIGEPLRTAANHCERRRTTANGGKPLRTAANRCERWRTTANGVERSRTTICRSFFDVTNGQNSIFLFIKNFQKKSKKKGSQMWSYVVNDSNWGNLLYFYFLNFSLSKYFSASVWAQITIFDIFAGP